MRASNQRYPGSDRTRSSSNVVRGGAAPRPSGSSSTVLVNLDIYLVRATIGRDISPADDDLLVLLRRNSKELPSEPARWHDDHVAAWSQRLTLQTSLLRNKHAASAPTHDFLPKDYELVLVALPSHSAVALFQIDFARIVQTQLAGRALPLRLAPLKCRDLAAALELEIVWEPAGGAPPPGGSASVTLPMGSPLGAGGPFTPTSSSLSAYTGMPNGTTSGRRTATSVVSNGSHGSGGAGDMCPDCRGLRRRLERQEATAAQLEAACKELQKRMDTLQFENEELAVREEAETQNAAQYRALNMRLLQELEVAVQFCAQPLQQKQKELAPRGSQAEEDQDDRTWTMFQPQLEFMDRVKGFHAELERIYATAATRESSTQERDIDNPTVSTPADAWKRFDFAREVRTALARNQRLQQQLQFLGRSMLYDVDPATGHDDDDNDGAYAHAQGEDQDAVPGMPRRPSQAPLRKVTNASTTTSGYSFHDDSQDEADENGEQARRSLTPAAPVRTITEQMNALERENIALRAKLEQALSSASASALVGYKSEAPVPRQAHQSPLSESAESTSSSMSSTRHAPQQQQQQQQLRDERDALARALEEAQRELEELRNNQPSSTEAAALASSGGEVPPSGSGPDFLNKIYVDVGKAKLALEEKVKRLNQELAAAQGENAHLAAALALQAPHSDDDDDGERYLPKARMSGEEETTATAAALASRGSERERVRELENELAQLRQTMEERDSQLKVRERELEFTRQHLNEKAALVTDGEAARARVEDELAEATQALATARQKISQLEVRIESLEFELQQLPVQRDSAATETSKRRGSAAGGGAEEIAELSKQLKLARQEVMQLRYRSNTLGSVHEKLEDALKEKKTLQVKLTTLEGQLYEQRSRTISDSNFATSGNALHDQEVAELRHQLQDMTAQVTKAQREMETMRRASSNSAVIGGDVGVGVGAGAQPDLEALERRVAELSREIESWSARNLEQEQRIEALGGKVATVTREKHELATFMSEFVQEMDAIAPVGVVRGGATRYRMQHSERDEDEEDRASERIDEEEDFDQEEKAPISAMERYRSAVASSSSLPGGLKPSTAGGGGGGTGTGPNRIAHLIKNFSTGVASVTGSDDDEDDGSGMEKRIAITRRGTAPGTQTGGAVDVRRRQGSAPQPAEASV